MNGVGRTGGVWGLIVKVVDDEGKGDRERRASNRLHSWLLLLLVLLLVYSKYGSGGDNKIK